MAYTQDDLDKLQAAMAKGATSLKLNGEEVVFRSLSEMERIETRMKQELGHVSSGRVTTISTSTGWR